MKEEQARHIAVRAAPGTCQCGKPLDDPSHHDRLAYGFTVSVQLRWWVKPLIYLLAPMLIILAASNRLGPDHIAALAEWIARRGFKLRID